MDERDFEDLEENLAMDIITITLDSDLGVPCVNLGQVSPPTAIAWLEYTAKWLKKTLPPPRVIYDDVTLISGFLFEDDDEDDDEEGSELL